MRKDAQPTTLEMPASAATSRQLTVRRCQQKSRTSPEVACQLLRISGASHRYTVGFADGPFCARKNECSLQRLSCRESWATSDFRSHPWCCRPKPFCRRPFSRIPDPSASIGSARHVRATVSPMPETISSQGSRALIIQQTYISIQQHAEANEFRQIVVKIPR